MGCGTSKAALVADTDITTRAMPPSPTPQNPSSSHEEPAQEHLSSSFPKSNLENSSSVGMSSFGAGTTSTGKRDQEESPKQSRKLKETESDRTADGRNVSNDRFAAFEVEVVHRDSNTPSVPPPRRLEKLINAPKVTAEMLAEKQRVVRERKDKVLENRSSRLSKKERLRKEIMESRELESTQSNTSQNEGSIAENASKSTLTKMGHGIDYLDEAVEMEVDQTYNDETQMDTWEGEGGFLSSPPDSSPPENANTSQAGIQYSLDNNNKQITATESFDNWG